jgi:hypothetical protein
VDAPKPKAKVEHRDGKIFVEGEKHPYMQGMIRSLRMSVQELCIGRSIRHDVDEGVANASYSLIGTARVSKDTLGIIGDKARRSKELPLTLKPWPKDEPPGAVPGETPRPAQKSKLRERYVAERKHGPWRGVLGFIEYDWEIGNPDEWFTEVYLPPPVFDELATLCRKGSLATLSLRFYSDLWVSDLDQHAPPSVAVTWHLAPGEHSSDLGFLALEDHYWTEKPLVLTGLKDEDSEEQEPNPDAQRKLFEANQLALVERIRKALYFMAAVLAAGVLILALK